MTLKGKITHVIVNGVPRPVLETPTLEERFAERGDLIETLRSQIEDLERRLADMTRERDEALRSAQARQNPQI